MTSSESRGTDTGRRVAVVTQGDVSSLLGEEGSGLLGSVIAGRGPEGRGGRGQLAPVQHEAPNTTGQAPERL